jgi:hypothetical protein
MVGDLLLIILASLFSTLLAEGISWVLIYRTASYQLLKASIDKTTKKCMFLACLVGVVAVVVCTRITAQQQLYLHQSAHPSSINCTCLDNTISGAQERRIHHQWLINQQAQEQAH